MPSRSSSSFMPVRTVRSDTPVEAAVVATAHHAITRVSAAAQSRNPARQHAAQSQRTSVESDRLDYCLACEKHVRSTKCHSAESGQISAVDPYSFIDWMPWSAVLSAPLALSTCNFIADSCLFCSRSTICCGGDDRLATGFLKSLLPLSEFLKRCFTRLPVDRECSAPLLLAATFLGEVANCRPASTEVCECNAGELSNDSDRTGVSVEVEDPSLLYQTAKMSSTTAVVIF